MIGSTTTPLQNRAVARWLLVCCALVFCMVVLGGVTRLTGSGLSMVDWRPVTGTLPPMSAAEWQASFDLYRQTPEFQKVNVSMDLDGYKGIFWLEYLHRLLGRIIGLAFLLPFLVFALRGFIARRDWPRYLLMFALGGLQGLLGWYMVKSGLVNDPHVSQYRLTAHLLAAFLIYGVMFWAALSLLFPRRQNEKHPWFGKTVLLTVLICITIVSGGFVAGLKAGKIYNTFPLMGDSLIPPGLLSLTPVWRNFFDNTTTVQFNHRLLAILTYTLIVAYWWTYRRKKQPEMARRACNGLLHAATLQVVLGISVLLLGVPIWLGALHQGTALLVFTAALFLTYSLGERG